ncbi:MAG: sigma-70 family RNA polymerase sigma factor [Deltaproteobacteria bacterium]|nr:sigma-70 family RNA polymerase sigma factor [Deltaproteobacteria bacterium]
MPAAARSTRDQLDQLTLKRAQRGDERAWRDLIERYQQPVHSLVWRLFAGRARHRVEDLVQETFVRVLEALPEFDPAGTATLSTWILTIATRLALNELRKVEPRLDVQVESVERADVTAERKQLARAIGEAVAELPDAQRAAFVLREYHGLEYAEIASVLELDLNTVKSRLNRARAALRARLAPVRTA